VPRDDLINVFRIARNAVACSQDGRPEPRFGAVPLQVELDAIRLETARATEQPPLGSQPRGRTLPWGMLASLAVHLSPLLLLLSWASAPAPVVTPIPIELVLEQPPPPPATKTEQKAEIPPPPPLGRLASIALGEPAKEELPPASSPDQPSPEPGEDQVATVRPPPSHDLVSALPKPVSPPETLNALPPLPEPAPPKSAAKPAIVSPHPPKPQLARPKVMPGPAATQDEYLAYISNLINRHKDLLAPSVLGGRRGVAVISITVLADGTIARVAVRRGSGYPDVDARIEQMITAVGRFPPLPQWIQAPSVMLDFHRVFPDSTL
jgi:TonB family protein